VHGYCYGTPAEPVRKALAQGICVILVIDVQGAFQVHEKVPNALLIFVHVPSLEVLEQRLRDRGTDDEPTIRRRLDNAKREIALGDRYDVHVVNDHFDRCVDELSSILVQNQCGALRSHD
jgi:guanylate kinase